MNQRSNDSLNKSNKALFSIAITCYFTLLEGKNESDLKGVDMEGEEE